jgi:hypothetical protein
MPKRREYRAGLCAAERSGQNAVFDGNVKAWAGGDHIATWNYGLCITGEKRTKQVGFSFGTVAPAAK